MVFSRYERGKVFLFGNNDSGNIYYIYTLSRQCQLCLNSCGIRYFEHSNFITCSIDFCTINNAHEIGYKYTVCQKKKTNSLRYDIFLHY